MDNLCNDNEDEFSSSNNFSDSDEDNWNHYNFNFNNKRIIKYIFIYGYIKKNKIIFSLY